MSGACKFLLVDVVRGDSTASECSPSNEAGWPLPSPYTLWSNETAMARCLYSRSAVYA